MHIPAQIAEHPVESCFAVVLLLAVLAGSAESGRDVPGAQAQRPVQTVAEKM